MTSSYIYGMLNDLENKQPRILQSSLAPESLIHGYRQQLYVRPWGINTKDTGPTVQCDKNQFKVVLDVHHFAPDEIKVKMADGHVVVEGKHEEKRDEHGFISRQFTRRYLVPKEYNIDAVQSHLSSDGILTISAPKLGAVEEKVIPIIRTGLSISSLKMAEKNE